MSTGVIRISAALFALALLVGVFGLNTQPAQAVKRVGINSTFASVPAARMDNRYASDAMPVNDGTVTAPIDRFTRDTASRAIRVASEGTTTTLVDEAIEYPLGATLNPAEGFDPTSLGTDTDNRYRSGVSVERVTLAEAMEDGDEPPAGTAVADYTEDHREYVAKLAALTEILLPAATDGGLEDLAKDSYVGDWVEILTGPAAGQVGYIIAYDADDGMLTFDGAENLHPNVAIADGNEYRIVEQNHSRMVEFAIIDDDGADDVLEDGTERRRDTFTVTVESDAADEDRRYSYAWTEWAEGLGRWG